MPRQPPGSLLLATPHGDPPAARRAAADQPAARPAPRPAARGARAARMLCTPPIDACGPRHPTRGARLDPPAALTSHAFPRPPTTGPAMCRVTPCHAARHAPCLHVPCERLCRAMRHGHGIRNVRHAPCTTCRAPARRHLACAMVMGSTPCAIRHAPCTMRHAPCTTCRAPARRHHACAMGMGSAPCAMRHAPCASCLAKRTGVRSALALIACSRGDLVTTSLKPGRTYDHHPCVVARPRPHARRPRARCL